jgi:hypothetical protein
MAFGCGAMAFKVGVLPLSARRPVATHVLSFCPPVCALISCARQGTGIKLQVADYWSGVEIEAPLDGSTPVEIHGAGTIDGILIGPPNSLVNGKASHYETLIKVDAGASGSWGRNPSGWHGGKPAGRSTGWSVNGLVIDNPAGFGSWDNTITVDGKALDPSFSNTSSMTVAQCMRFGDTMAQADVPTTNCLYLDPTNKKLCYRDATGKVHPLY